MVDKLKAVDRSGQGQAGTVEIDVAGPFGQSILGALEGFLGTTTIDLGRGLGRIGDDREGTLLDASDSGRKEHLDFGAVGSRDLGEARLDREGGVGVPRADAHETIADGEDHLARVTLPSDLFGIDDLDGNHLEASSAAFSMASSMVPT